ncbi:hypothetical protein QFC22_000554 [Naganishia vaughanmartiniae]|uniref:Uncharacterized protein n=1 Tax=Naganishia vaughanmartiniae TaxID=1424756 RepID=A0ACC2XQQ6_9TREE|nr:hypothetical protein QFC22_000554 [Naganishia vaughanmartiniae]
MVSSSRPRAISRTYSTAPLSTRPAMESRMSNNNNNNGMRFAPSSVGGELQRQQTRGYASDKGKMELYSDEEGSIGAGIDDVAKTDAAFNSETNPHKAAKQVEQESGKSMQKTPANEDYSRPLNPPAETSNTEANKNGGFKDNQ